MPARRPPLTALALAGSLFVGLLGGCVGTEVPGQARPSPATATATAAQTEPAEDGGPLFGLPPCQDPPAAAADAGVEGLDLPEGAIVTNVVRGDPLVTVTGYIPQTPVRVRQFYQRRDDLDILEIEDEIFEAETLFGNGTHRNYVKAQAVCRQGSNFLAVVAPEVDAKGLPEPAGSPTPAP
ncbi:MAG: hypothetical protein H0V19_06385 [Euzebyales bacterium]|nr:hypothetical protein [Euzebyales bacterium]